MTEDSSGDMTDMSAHFSSVAPAYNDLRATDAEPVEYVRRALAGLVCIRTADIGCGAGRYSLLLLRAIPRMKLLCVDSNRRMLAECTRYLSENWGWRFDTSSIDCFEYLNACAVLGTKPWLSAIFCFNAIHHLGFIKLLRFAALALRPGGHLFIYTRTRSQNAGSVWGRHFPGFAEHETRLYEQDEMEEWAREDGNYGERHFTPFRYEREATLGHLIYLARSRHYSTFSLYTPAELEAAIAGFEANLRREYPDPERIAWLDGNLMVHLRMAARDEQV